MKKKRRSPPGSAPATLVPHLVNGLPTKPSIQVIQYSGTFFSEADLDCLDSIKTPSESDNVTWINIDGLGDAALLTTLGARYNLHPLALEDVLNTGQRPKFEASPHYLFMVLQMVYENRDQIICGEQVSLFLGKNFIITIQEEGEYDVFDPVRNRIRSGLGRIRACGADYLAYALLDSIIDHFYPVIEDIGTKIEMIEDELIARPTQNTLHTLHEYKRSLAQIRRYTWPIRDVVSGLLHDNTGYMSPATQVYLRDCYDHSVQLMELVDTCKEHTTGLMDLYHSSTSYRTNEIMRVLTVITSIFIPLTFISSIYGMNFATHSPSGKKLPLNMPELYLPYGYIGLLVLMATIACVQILIFRKMKWL